MSGFCSAGTGTIWSCLPRCDDDVLELAVDSGDHAAIGSALAKFVNSVPRKKVDRVELATEILAG